MMDLRANRSVVYFRNYLGESEIIDQYGNATGQFEPQYGEKESQFLCVSPSRGSQAQEQFGSFTDYDRTMVTSDTSCPITEKSVLWIDGVETTAHNYIVTKRAVWKNSIVYAIKEVTVSEYSG